MPGKIIVSGVGCCLVDFLFNNMDFSCDTIRPYLSLKRGDGGLIPGRLVFKEEFEKFSRSAFEPVFNRITGGRSPDKINIGGPSIVSLIHVAQLVDNETCEVRFYGRSGNDDAGRCLLASLQKTPVILHDYKLIDNQTPSTFVKLYWSCLGL
jgi:sugar/nucleoside kinase (ribokinase family)